MRVLACLEEKELGYEFIPVNLRTGESKKEPFLSLNPFGQVPVLEDGDLKLFESRAITKYIAYTYAKNGTPLVCQDPKKMAMECVWMEVEAQRYENAAAKLTWELCIKPNKGMATDDAIVEEYEAKLATVLDVYEDRLANSKYLAGDCFTLADFHHLPTLNYLMGTKIKALFDSRIHVNTWCADILARPAWKKVFAMKDNK
ncbi:Glutathione S-transferase F8 [Abeliophyllum distichum]|uniref:glutathione transferase n=1 Tax=Abeliophyllum distichum TaxID=126358 RepID=A0ABD1VT34_9LAMI